MPLRAQSKTEGCRSVVEQLFAGNPEKLGVVFDEIVVFRANLSPQDLAGEAFRHLADVEHPARRLRVGACRRNDVPGRVAAISRYEGRTPGLEAALSCRAYHGYLIEF